MANKKTGKTGKGSNAINQGLKRIRTMIVMLAHIHIHIKANQAKSNSRW